MQHKAKAYASTKNTNKEGEASLIKINHHHCYVVMFIMPILTTVQIVSFVSHSVYLQSSGPYYLGIDEYYPVCISKVQF